MLRVRTRKRKPRNSKELRGSYRPPGARDNLRAVSPRNTPRKAAMIGSSLGPYRLVETLGQGGMGVVYKAIDTRLGRTVAVKLLPPAPPGAAPDAERSRRFLVEAQAASALNHPHIVTVHDVGREGDVEFIVLEFVAGRTLAAQLAAGPLPVGRALEVARQVADALAAAHAAGIVHRDLKPQNVMLAEDGRAKVLDFGLARIAVDATDATVAAGYTLPGTVLGTPAYMSPEQVEGRAVDARSDVYSAGVLLYEMLTAQRPFRDTSYAAAVHAVVYEDPVPVRERRPDVPRPLARVIERCLAKAPGERYANGAELRAALEAIAHALESGAADGGDSVAGRVRDAAAGARRGWRRGRGLALVAAALLAIAAGAITLVPAFRSRVAALVPAGAPSTYALYQAGMAELDRYYEPGRTDRAIAAFEQAVAADSAYAPGYVGLAEGWWRRYRENRDEALLRRATEYARHAVALDPQLARARVARGLAAVEAKDYAAARADFDQALALDPANAQAHRGLASIHLAEARPAAAESSYARAIALAPGDWEIVSQRGVLHFQAGRYEQALADFEAGARLSPANPLVHRNVGGAHHMLGHYPEAAASFQRSIEIRPDPAVYSNLGTVWFFQGLYAQAVGAFERSVELGPNNATIWRNLGDAYRQAPGSAAKAREAYGRAAQLLREERAKEPGDPVLAAELALCLARRGEAPAARALADSIDAAGRALPEVAYALVLAHEALGDRAAALAALRAAVAAGHPVEEIRTDPELVALRRDSAYHRILAAASP
jgi:tetratricopeptide (TPR) repeat protein